MLAFTVPPGPFSLLVMPDVGDKTENGDSEEKADTRRDAVHALLEAFVDGTRVDLAVAGPELPRGASVMESRGSVPGGRLEVFAV